MPTTEITTAQLDELEVPANDVKFAIEAAAAITKIDDEDDRETVAELLSQIQAASKQIEEQRQSLTKPLNSVLRQINEAAKKAQGELPDASAHLRKVLSNYLTEQAQARADAEKAAQDESGQAVVDPGSLPAATAPSTRTSSGTVGSRTRTTFEITDARAFIVACSKTKKAWEEHGDMVMPSVTYVNDAVKKGRIPEGFPGIRVFEKADVVVR